MADLSEEMRGAEGGVDLGPLHCFVDMRDEVARVGLRATHHANQLRGSDGDYGHCSPGPHVGGGASAPDACGSPLDNDSSSAVSAFDSFFVSFRLISIVSFILPP